MYLTMQMIPKSSRRSRHPRQNSPANNLTITISKSLNPRKSNPNPRKSSPNPRKNSPSLRKSSPNPRKNSPSLRKSRR